MLASSAARSAGAVSAARASVVAAAPSAARSSANAAAMLTGTGTGTGDGDGEPAAVPTGGVARVPASVRPSAAACSAWSARSGASRPASPGCARAVRS